jgi:hypothetical protein
MDIDSNLYDVVRNYVRTIAGNDQSPVTEEQLYTEIRSYIIRTYSLSGGTITEAELTSKIRNLVSTLVSEELAAGNISQWVNTSDLFTDIDALIQASIATSFSIPAINVNNYITNGTVLDNDKIREIIEDMLDGKLDNIIDGLDQYGNYVEYAFKNSPTQPMTPVGGSYDGITFTYPDGWTDDPVSTTNGADKVWVSYSKWKKVNNVYTSINGWSTPIPISGADGVDGVAGQDGIGTDGNWHEYIYTISDYVTPSTPVGGYLDNNNDIHPPAGWEDNPIPTTSIKPYLYMSKGTFKKQGNSWVQIDSWSAPVRTTGPSGVDGKNGKDGVDGAHGPKVISDFVYWSNTSTAPTSNPTASSYSFTTDSFTGLSAGWQRTPPTLSTGTTTSAIYYATFYAVESVAGSNIATNITFGSYTKGTEFKGLVVFTAADADAKIASAATTITNAIKNGLATQNYTTINGGNITTGTINAQQVTITNLRVTGDMLFSGFSKTYPIGVNARNAGTTWDPYFAPLPTAAGSPTNSGDDKIAFYSDITWFNSSNFMYDGVVPYDNSHIVSYRGVYQVPSKYQICIKNNFGAAASVSADLTSIFTTSPTPASGVGATNVSTDGYTGIILSAGPGYYSTDVLNTSGYAYMPGGCRIIGTASGGISYITNTQQRILVNSSSKVNVGEYLYVTVVFGGSWAYSSATNNKTWFAGLSGNVYLTI